MSGSRTAHRASETRKPVVVGLFRARSRERGDIVAVVIAGSIPSYSDRLLTDPVVDQAALHGLLRKVRDLGMPLLAVIRIEPGQADASGGTQ
jgi:hypothetical protein